MTEKEVQTESETNLEDKETKTSKEKNALVKKSVNQVKFIMKKIK